MWSFDCVVCFYFTYTNLIPFAVISGFALSFRFAVITRFARHYMLRMSFASRHLLSFRAMRCHWSFIENFVFFVSFVVKKLFYHRVYKAHKGSCSLSVSNTPNLHICTLINLHIFPCLSAFFICVFNLFFN